MGKRNESRERKRKTRENREREIWREKGGGGLRRMDGTFGAVIRPAAVKKSMGLFSGRDRSQNWVRGKKLYIYCGRETRTTQILIKDKMIGGLAYLFGKTFSERNFQKN